jgi:hypothetical protein
MGDSADETGDDIQARSILCSDAVVARMSSGFARFIHPGNPVTQPLPKETSISQEIVLVSRPRGLPKVVLVGLVCADAVRLILALSAQCRSLGGSRLSQSYMAPCFPSSS